MDKTDLLLSDLRVFDAKEKLSEAGDVIEDLRDKLKEIYNLLSFDYDTMPESMKKEAVRLAVELAEEGLK